MMFCEKCGAQLGSEDTFCMNCGQKVLPCEPTESNNVTCDNCGEVFSATFDICPHCGSVRKPSENDIDKHIGLKCPMCNQSIKASDSFCDHCGASLNADSVSDETDDDVLRCSECGLEIKDGEKYCVRCGTPVHSTGKVEEPESSALQNELSKTINKNKISGFISKYAAVFAIIYPVYLICGNVTALNGIYNAIDFASTIMFYLYYFSLICLFANNKHLPLIIALGLRGLNSFIYIFSSGIGVSSVVRLVLIIPALIYLFKKYSVTEQYQNLKKNLNLETKTCSQCGANVKVNDAFCPKCGKKM